MAARLDDFQTCSLGSRGFYGQPGCLPGGKSSQECLDVGKAQVHQFLCHTGTLLLLPSGAVEDQERLRRQIVVSRVNLCLWKRKGTCGMRLVVGCLTSNVNQKGLTLLH